MQSDPIHQQMEERNIPVHTAWRELIKVLLNRKHFTRRATPLLAQHLAESVHGRAAAPGMAETSRVQGQSLECWWDSVCAPGGGLMGAFSLWETTMQHAHKMNTTLNIYCGLSKKKKKSLEIFRSLHLKAGGNRENDQESKTSLNVCCYICLTLESSVCFIYLKTLIQ